MYWSILVRVALTAKRIADFSISETRDQGFLWDSGAPGLALRKTKSGSTAFIYQGRYVQKTIRITIGKANDWSLPDARKKAREIQRLIDSGDDPRLVMEEKRRQQTEKRRVKRLHALTLENLWQQWAEQMASSWSANTLRDSEKIMQAGGEPRKRWRGKQTKPGPLASLAKVKVVDINHNLLARVAIQECKVRPAQFRLALRMLRACLNWAADELSLQPQAGLTSSRRLLRIVGKPLTRNDCLERDQLKEWFAHVIGLKTNEVVSAYLQCLLLTGARRNELLQLRWVDVDLKWNQLTIADKVEAHRTIPLTPYVKALIEALPKQNEWVFFSKLSRSGHLIDPSIAHRKLCANTGLKVTLHGLRRSFKSLSEWLEIPVGVIAQIMGHKPSAIAEKHYTIRPVDLLRVHHSRLEAWILEQADVELRQDSGNHLSLVNK